MPGLQARGGPGRVQIPENRPRPTPRTWLEGRRGRYRGGGYLAIVTTYMLTTYIPAPTCCCTCIVNWAIITLRRCKKNAPTWATARIRVGTCSYLNLKATVCASLRYLWLDILLLDVHGMFGKWIFHLSCTSDFSKICYTFWLTIHGHWGCFQTHTFYILEMEQP